MEILQSFGSFFDAVDPFGSVEISSVASEGCFCEVKLLMARQSKCEWVDVSSWVDAGRTGGPAIAEKRKVAVTSAAALIP